MDRYGDLSGLAFLAELVHPASSSQIGLAVALVPMAEPCRFALAAGEAEGAPILAAGMLAIVLEEDGRRPLGRLHPLRQVDGFVAHW
jgi:hypothetical protein